MQQCFLYQSYVKPDLKVDTQWLLSLQYLWAMKLLLTAFWICYYWILIFTSSLKLKYNRCLESNYYGINFCAAFTMLWYDSNGQHFKKWGIDGWHHSRSYWSLSCFMNVSRKINILLLQLVLWHNLVISQTPYDL